MTQSIASIPGVTTPSTDIGHVLVDMDGTLAEYLGWHADGSIGPPIPVMVDRVKGWIQLGVDVRIFTARVALVRGGDIPTFDPVQVQYVQAWCEQHLGKRLPVQFWKDFGTIVMFDDRARQVELNTGRLIGE